MYSTYARGCTMTGSMSALRYNATCQAHEFLSMSNRQVPRHDVPPRAILSANTCFGAEETICTIGGLGSRNRWHVSAETRVACPYPLPNLQLCVASTLQGESTHRVLNNSILGVGSQSLHRSLWRRACRYLSRVRTIIQQNTQGLSSRDVRKS